MSQNFQPNVTQSDDKLLVIGIELRLIYLIRKSFWIFGFKQNLLVNRKLNSLTRKHLINSVFEFLIKSRRHSLNRIFDCISNTLHL